MRRVVLIAVLILTATLAGAQAPKAPAAPSPGDKCLGDLPQWQTYAGSLKSSRDATEQDAAAWKTRAEALQVQLAASQKRVAELEKTAPKP